VVSDAACGHDRKPENGSHITNELEDRLCALHVAASFDALSDDDIRTPIRSLYGGGDVGDLNQHYRALVLCA